MRLQTKMLTLIQFVYQYGYNATASPDDPLDLVPGTHTCSGSLITGDVGDNEPEPAYGELSWALYRLMCTIASCKSE